MNESLWSWSLTDLRQRTASAAPTPGGGSIAAVSAVLGCSLVIMAIDVTVGSASGPRTDLDLNATRTRLATLSDSMAAAADSDILVFDEVMSAYRLPRSDADETAFRRAAIARASADAAEVPLQLAEDCGLALAIVPLVEAAVVTSIASDVLAGRDLLVGAARAALHTVSVNLPALAAEHRDPLTGRVEAVHAVVNRSQP